MSNHHIENLKGFVVEVFVPGTSIAAHTYLAALAQLDPVTAAVYAGSAVFLSRMRESRRKVFADGLGKIPELTEEIVTSEEFAMAFSVTAEAASRTASEEKIRLIARILRNGTSQNLIGDFDIFREYIKIADELSPREIGVLFLFNKYMIVEQSRNRQGETLMGPIEFPQNLSDPDYSEEFVQAVKLVKEDKYARKDGERLDSNIFYHLFRDKMRDRYKLSEEGIDSFLTRLSRTGLIIPVQNWGTSYLKAPLFDEWFRYIQEEGGASPTAHRS